MEHLMHPLFNPYLQNVIKTFQTTAGKSLRGPSGYSSSWNDQVGERNKYKMSEEDYEEYKRAFTSTLKRESEDLKAINIDPFLVPPPFPIQQMPIFIPPDTCDDGLSKTMLDGVEISCFNIGGEKRLCLPQILNTLLRQFLMDDVHEASRELNLNFSRCTPNQLLLLKRSNVLPSSAQNCGLITKTDAQRLSNKLLLSGESAVSISTFSSNSFKVYHECFGKCKGLLDPGLYKSEDAPCIACCECNQLFTTQKFVCHSHAVQENRVCHWGFDSANWRSYLMLAKDQEHLQTIVRCLNEVKDRYSKNRRKRKQVENGESDEKRVRENLVPLTAYGSLPKDRLPTELKQSPPIVLNPEKIVPFSGHDRYDRDFVPNISLAPSNKFKKDFDCNSRAPLLSASSEGHDAALDIDVSSTDSDSEDVAMLSSPAQRSEESERGRAYDQLCLNRQKELTLVQRALDGDIGADRASKEAFLKEYLESRATEQKMVHDLSKSKVEMQKELNKLWSKNEQMTRDLREARRSADRVRVESRMRAHEAAEDRREMQREMDELHRLHARNLEQIKNKQHSEADELHTRIEQFEKVFVQLGQEICYLRDELRKTGKDVPDTQAQLAAGATTSSTSCVPKSPLPTPALFLPIKEEPAATSDPPN